MLSKITRLKVRRYSIMSLSVCLTFIISCKKEEGQIGTPYKIFSLEEFVGGSAEKRTSQVLACRLDDEFYFNEGDELWVFMGSQKCNLDPKKSIGATWELTSVDSMQADYLALQGALTYVVHDSLRMGQTVGQWTNNNSSQLYKVIEFIDSVIVVQTLKDLSLPKTQNIWQLTLKKI